MPPLNGIGYQLDFPRSPPPHGETSRRREGDGSDMKKFRKTHDFGSIGPRWSAVTIACARFDTSSFSYSRSTYGDREDDDPGQHARDADHEQLEQGEAGLVSAAGPSRAVAGTPDCSGDKGPKRVVHAAFPLQMLRQATETGSSRRGSRERRPSSTPVNPAGSASHIPPDDACCRAKDSPLQAPRHSG